MAKAPSSSPRGKSANTKKVISGKHLRTSIGHSTNSRQKNKSKRRSTKPYKGQGKPL